MPRGWLVNMLYTLTGHDFEIWKKEQDEREKARPKKPHELAIAAPKGSENKMMELICNDRMGGKVRIKCFPSDTILMVKKIIALHTGTRFEKIRL